MSEKKNIDRLFQEQFKEFEAAPPEYVWENIHEALREKKKRRIIPLWFRLSGVAAVLIAVLFAGWQLLHDNDRPDGRVVIEEPSGSTLPEDVVTRPANVVEDKNDNKALGNDAAVADGDDNDSFKNDPATVSSKDYQAESYTDDAPFTAAGIAGGSKKNSRRSGMATTGIAARDRTNALKANMPGGRGENNSGFGSGQKGLASSGDAGRILHSQRDNIVNVPEKEVEEKAILKAKNEDAVAGNEVNNDSGNKANSNIYNGLGRENDMVPVIDKSDETDEAITQVAIDTVMPIAENELEKLLREQNEDKKEEQVAEAKANRWSVKPQLAPVFYNSLSEGSPIDQQFASNAKSFDNDMSYGVGINYAINNKITIRSGVNTVNLNYATQGVQFYASLSQATNNVSPKARNANIVVQSAAEGQPMQNAFTANTADSYRGAMVQQTGYVEVPLEMSYALLDKRFGIDIIGGVSTLFLNQNNVSVISTQGLSTSVGEAENLNNIHFSTNIGVGFKYRFFKAFEASFEPMFKYQVNTFSRDAGNFKPYFVGLYSGISFSF